MAEGSQPVRYSIAIPLFNERESILPLYERLKAAMDPLGRPWECVFVDDGSTDDSLAVLQQIALGDSRIIAVCLRQNSGKSLALSSAFSVARGDFIITMD